MLAICILILILPYAIIGTVVGTIGYHQDNCTDGTYYFVVGIVWPAVLSFYLPFLLLRLVHRSVLNRLNAKATK